jgi:hypothetical protein
LAQFGRTRLSLQPRISPNIKVHRSNTKGRFTLTPADSNLLRVVILRQESVILRIVGNSAVARQPFQRGPAGAVEAPRTNEKHENVEFRDALSWCCRQLARAALLLDNRVTRRFYRINQLESVNWTWGLSLIALTIAIHAAGVVMMVLVGFRIRVRWRPGSLVYVM